MYQNTQNGSIKPSVLERNPVIIAHSPKHQRIWNSLSVGTLFTVARVADDLNVDLETLESNDLESLIGRNGTIGCVEEILQRGRLEQQQTKQLRPEKELETVCEELDWEADQIVRGTGEMLGWQEERNTRYGGKVQFSAVLMLDEKKDRKKDRDKDGAKLNLTHARLRLDPLRLRGSSLFSRTHGSHHFLYLRFHNTIMKRVSVFGGTVDDIEENRTVLREWAVRPIFILGRVYAPLLEKDDAIVYFLEGPEQVGSAFDRGKRGYGIAECKTVREFIDWWIPLDHNGEKRFRKLSTRLELGLSDSLPGVFIMPEDVKIVHDIVNDDDVEFTDGAGIMSPSISAALHEKYRDTWATHSLHMAYQVRLHTAKGVLLVDPTMLAQYNFDGPHRVKLYKSMCKSRSGGGELRSGPVNGFHILDAARSMLCIIKPAPSSSPLGARLSYQFITILSGCGVTKELFLRRQKESLEKELAVWTEISTEAYYDNHTQETGARIDEKTRLKLARMLGISKGLHSMVKKKELGGAARALGYGETGKADIMDEAEEVDNFIGSSDADDLGGISVESVESQASTIAPDPWADNEISGLPALKSKQFQLALLSGIDVVRSEYWFSVWVDIVKATMFDMVSKFHLPLERSASGFLQPDPTGILEEGQVCFTVKGTMIDTETGLSGVIPLASLCAGGDYDGGAYIRNKDALNLIYLDVATIIWDKFLVSQFQNADPSLRNPPPGFEERFSKDKTKTIDVVRELKDLEEPDYSLKLATRLMASIGEGQTFKIYSKYWNLAEYLCVPRGGVVEDNRRKTALIMAHTFNSLMDSKKTGVNLKKDILAKDKKEWSRFEEPYWSRRPKEHTSSRAYGHSKQRINNTSHILDQLVHSGEEFMNTEIKRLKEQLRPEEGKGDLYFNGNGIDYDLEIPYLRAKEWTKGDSTRVALLTEMEESVQRCWKSFSELNMDAARSLAQSGPGTAKTPTTMAQRQMRLREICSEFAKLPVGSEDTRGDLVAHGEWLISVKASYAYLYDIQRRGRGGSKSRFPWHIAMRELCNIKAKAIGGSTVTLPYSVVEKMEVHKDWA